MSTEVSTERMQPHSYSYDSFQLVGPVRHGGMATVRQACLKETGAICALKFPKREGFEGIASLSLTRELKALSDLEHNNIVRLFGLGTDGAERFLVFEWLQETLEERIRSLGPSDWRDYYEQVGRPLLEALRYAHARGRVHRDLKPSNVMFSDQMVPKITDFGIARDLTEVHIGRTFAAVGSHPWTPAEQDDGMQSERRDLYSWAAICVASLTGRLDYRSSAELRSAAEKLQSVAPSHLLTRCLSDTPEERPVSATALLWDLDDYHRLRLDAANVERLIGVEVSMGAHQKLATLIPNETITSKRVSTLFADISTTCEVLKLPEGDLEFTGGAFRVRAGRHSSLTPWLSIKDVGAPIPPIGPSVGARIRFVQRTGESRDLHMLRTNIAFLESLVESALEREREAQRARDQERYLVMQQEVLASRLRALRDLPALRYRNGRWAANEFTVELDEEDLEPPEQGEQRIIRTSAGIFVFAVSKVAQDRVWLRPVGAKRGAMPPEGRLQVDTVAQRRAIERQEESLKLVRSGQTALPGLKRILLNPGEAEAPEAGGRPPPEHLSQDKRTVLDAALGIRQLMLVKGPPGTGKTTLITEIVKQYLKENPFARILISAQTHIAIDHVIAKLMDVPELRERIVRVARLDEDKVAAAVKPALLHNRVLKWCEEAASRARLFAKERGDAVGLSSSDVELSVRLEMLVLACERLTSVERTLKESEGQLSAAQSGVAGAGTRDFTQVESATIATMSLAECVLEKKRLAEQVLRLRQELRELGEDGRALSDLPSDGLREWLILLEENNVAWPRFRKELEVQVAWLDLLGQLKRLEAVVLRSASVVAGTCVGLGGSDAFADSRFDLCIIDEASKATATEALFPMARSVRCLLVGDPKQLPPFDYGPCDVEGYSEEEIKETLLDYLLSRLPSHSVFELTHQHRMCQGIGGLISAVFYDGELINTRPDSCRPQWLRRHFSKPVVWVDTRGFYQRRQDHTYTNVGEQDVVLEQLTTLNRLSDRAGAVTSVAVIAGYAAQASALEARIQPAGFKALHIEVATVDSFQGKESDVCIFSVTLSNSRDFLGFLRSTRRLNVALSRARDLLMITGDQRFCYQVPGQNPFVALIDYLEAHRSTCETRNVRK